MAQLKSFGSINQLSYEIFGSCECKLILLLLLSYEIIIIIIHGCCLRIFLRFCLFFFFFPNHVYYVLITSHSCVVWLLQMLDGLTIRSLALLTRRC